MQAEASPTVILDSYDTGDPNAAINKKLREFFDGKIVRKDLTKKIREGANVPVYALEYLLGQYLRDETADSRIQRHCRYDETPGGTVVHNAVQGGY